MRRNQTDETQTAEKETEIAGERERESELCTGCDGNLYLMGWSAGLYFLDPIYYSYAGYREGQEATALNINTSACVYGCSEGYTTSFIQMINLDLRE